MFLDVWEATHPGWYRPLSSWLPQSCSCEGNRSGFYLGRTEVAQQVDVQSQPLQRAEWRKEDEYLRRLWFIFFSNILCSGEVRR